MKSACNAVENSLARLWPYIGIGTLLLILVGCAHSVVNPDGTVSVVGEDLIPGVLPESEAVRDVLGAANDAIQQVDPAEVIEAVSGFDWLQLGGIVTGLVVSVIGGVKLRQKLRRKTNAPLPG